MDFEQRAATAGLVVPTLVVTAAVSRFLGGCTSGGLECIGDFLLAGLLLVVAVPTVVLIAPLLSTLVVDDTAMNVLTVVFSVVTSFPLWWLLARRTARRVRDQAAPWRTFAWRWLGVAGVWFASFTAFTILAVRFLG